MVLVLKEYIFHKSHIQHLHNFVNIQQSISWNKTYQLCIDSMSKRHVFKNSPNQLVLIPKATSTTSADTVPLSVQFQQIQEAARQPGSTTKCKSYFPIPSKYWACQWYNITHRSSYIRMSTDAIACAITVN